MINTSHKPLLKSYSTVVNRAAPINAHVRGTAGRGARGSISETKVIGLRDGSSRNDGSSCNVSCRFRNFHDVSGTPTEAVVATSAPT